MQTEYISRTSYVGQFGLPKSSFKLGFHNCGCRFSRTLQKTEGTLVLKSRVKNHISSKSLGAKSVFLQICGRSCTHTNDDPALNKNRSKFIETV